ncbi:MAG: PfaD family polyunsaturated fatty acid/polyketide biosynthesis protein [Deltaproteobacteria bacterium]|nr:PfaD family polyunsaturated fatty acid/polyketide biosynthesis protein [Deltaproteobacteria bacterium]
MAPGSSAPSAWQSASVTPAFAPADVLAAVHRVRATAHLVADPAQGLGVAIGGEVIPSTSTNGIPHWRHMATLPPLYPEWLGDRTFAQVHGVRFPYVSGAMANGIATVRLVTEMARAGFLGFFGAAGLSVPRIEAAVTELRANLGDAPGWGCNLIHNPHEPSVEEATADLYIRTGVTRVSAAAYLALTPAIVRFALSGLRQQPDGSIHRERFVFAKISRPETARAFLEPAPAAMVQGLVDRGLLTAEEARLAARVPVAEDFIVESDSGGHTDNRPLGALLPTLLGLRDEIAAEHSYSRPIRMGAAGGIGTPSAAAAAFALGAAFVVTGSVNQGCVESGLDASGRAMLAEADLADVIMAPAADMFEMGVEVQVLRRGTMFAVRGRKLYELYRAYPSLEAIPAHERSKVERTMLRATFDEAWQSTRAFWAERDPREVAKAEADPKHRMALVFRSYLGQSSRWAIAGLPERRADYQIWCGPAMGAFNRWARGSFLEDPANRTVVQVARNLMEGAAVVTRAQQLRCCGVPVPPSAFDFRPRPLA